MAQNRQRISHTHPGSGSAPSGPTSGGQGTLGGRAQGSVGSRPGRVQMQIGDEGYLWLLIFLEVGTLAWLRRAFRRHHGG